VSGPVTSSRAPATERVRLRVEGTVQGVGFRPHAYRLATELGLSGFVRNGRRGVVVEAEGAPHAIAELAKRLQSEAPPLARIERIVREELTAGGDSGFHVARSASGEARAAIPPDAATCEACRAELFDRADRRFRYPFITCTDCGPRLTIATGAPYDRALTTMSGFAMCPQCEDEFRDPANRRFESQTNACPRCGPRVQLLDANRVPVDAGDPIGRAAELICGGGVVAIKGIGGFHLACDATDEAAVARLRLRKRRDSRPFALMVADVDAADELVELDARTRALLTGSARPIVIAVRNGGTASVAAAVAPRCPELGVMLPYTPLHHLLLADAGRPLVMTSGNVANEPIAYRDDDARAHLGGIADAFLVHDREIATRADDSVVRTKKGRLQLLLRRSRGYAPEPLPLPGSAAPVLGVGAELKGTVCIGADGKAWLSQHLGDLRTYDTLLAHRRERERLAGLLSLRPRIVAHDLHPDYLSTAEALSIGAEKRIAVQHHHAHFAACLAEHREDGAAVGAILDGAGLGTDGGIWGGEILAGGIQSCVRAGHLFPVALPGGDAAGREPWRMACAWLAAALGEEVPPVPATLASSVTKDDWAMVAKLGADGAAAPRTTSAGRLFDAIAAVCGIRARTSYEGQAAAELEWAADPREGGRLPLPVCERDGVIVLDARDTVLAADAATRAGAPVAQTAARFHNALGAAIAAACATACESEGTRTVCLAGGVFQNAQLVARTRAELEQRRLRALVPELLPPNDGAVSYGQVAVASATCENRG
jgi:hydrogenase maturation protein HypF